MTEPASPGSEDTPQDFEPDRDPTEIVAALEELEASGVAIADRLASAVSSAEESSTAAATARAACTDAQSKIDALLIDLTAKAKEAATSVTAIDAAQSSATIHLANAQADQEKTAELAATSAALKTTISKQRQELEALSQQAVSLAETVESLLPGATSTGLAVAFMERKTKFTKPKRIWAGVAISAILGVGALGLFGEDGFLDLSADPTADWQAVLLSAARRLPVAAALVWLAIVAGRQHMIAMRLEEDYAYKEAVSRAFEGYKREMSDIAPEAVAAGGVLPLATLCENVLDALAAPPGRLHDKPSTIQAPSKEMLAQLGLSEPALANLATFAGSDIKTVRAVLTWLAQRWH